jgi:hypothetical protein
VATATRCSAFVASRSDIFLSALAQDIFLNDRLVSSVLLSVNGLGRRILFLIPFVHKSLSPGYRSRWCLFLIRCFVHMVSCPRNFVLFRMYICSCVCLLFQLPQFSNSMVTTSANTSPILSVTPSSFAGSPSFHPSDHACHSKFRSLYFFSLDSGNRLLFAALRLTSSFSFLSHILLSSCCYTKCVSRRSTAAFSVETVS